MHKLKIYINLKSEIIGRPKWEVPAFARNSVSTNPLHG